jgi:hypothetical protein
MIIGMIPMALGLGEGAEQNAPLGRAVIGGLLFATVSTLFFVPLIFAGIHSRLARREANRNDGNDNGNGNNHGNNDGGGNDRDHGPAPDPSGAGTHA